MNKFVLLTLLLGIQSIFAQSTAGVPKALLGKWIAVDTLNPEIQRGNKPGANDGRQFKISRTWAICEFFPDNHVVIEATENHPKGASTSECELVSVKPGKMVLAYEPEPDEEEDDDYNPEDGYKEETEAALDRNEKRQEEHDFFYLKPNYFGIVFEDDYFFFKLKDTVYFQRAEPIWRKEKTE